MTTNTANTLSGSFTENVSARCSYASRMGREFSAHDGIYRVTFTSDHMYFRGGVLGSVIVRSMHSSHLAPYSARYSVTTTDIADGDWDIRPEFKESEANACDIDEDYLLVRTLLELVRSAVTA